MEFIVTLMVMSGLNVTHASHPTTLPAQKIPHQLENTLAHLWNVKKIDLIFHLHLISFSFVSRCRVVGKRSECQNARKKVKEMPAAKEVHPTKVVT